MVRKKLSLSTAGRGTHEITSQIRALVTQETITCGLCHLFVRHASAALVISENADPAVQKDLDMFMARLVPDGEAEFLHRAEGKDDMAAHIRSILTHTSITIPIENSDLALGSWQGIFLWEHRSQPHSREIIVTMYGDGC